MKTREIKNFLKAGTFELQVIKLLEMHNEEIRDMQKAVQELAQMNEMTVNAMSNLANGTTAMNKRMQSVMGGEKEDDGLGPSTQSIGDN